MKFSGFALSDGDMVWINPAQVTAVRSFGNKSTVIYLTDKQSWAVSGPVDTVLKVLSE